MNAAPVLCHVRAQNADQATGLNNIKKPGPPIRKHRAAPVATLSILFTPPPPGELRYCTRGEASRPVHVGVQCTHCWVPQLDPWCGVCVLAPAWGRRAQLPRFRIAVRPPRLDLHHRGACRLVVPRQRQPQPTARRPCAWMLLLLMLWLRFWNPVVTKESHPQLRLLLPPPCHGYVTKSMTA